MNTFGDFLIWCGAIAFGGVVIFFLAGGICANQDGCSMETAPEWMAVLELGHPPANTGHCIADFIESIRPDLSSCAAASPNQCTFNAAEFADYSRLLSTGTAQCSFNGRRD